MPATPPRIVQRVCLGSLLGRLPRRSSLLVLSVALTLGPGLPDARLVAASPAPPAQVTEAATDILSADTADAITASTLKPPVLGDGDRVPASGSSGSARIQRSPAEPSASCTTRTAVVTGHRDDTAAHPGLAATGTCPLAGPKRFHDAAHRSVAAASVSPVTTAVVATSTPADPRWTGGYNLYRKTAFVTQRDFKWCVAASVQMMVNIVRHRSDRTAATQRRMISYAQASDHGPWGPGGGTDVTGWISALRHFGAGKYRAVGARSASAALRLAATAMRQTGRPAGMLVMEGRHAWILHGFESRTDPRRDRKARITSVRVSGPLYPIQQKHGYDLRPNTELSVRALARYFTPSSVGALVGRYVVIVPVH